MNLRRNLAFVAILLVVVNPMQAAELAVVSRAEHLVAFVELETGRLTSTVPTGRNPHEILVTLDRRLALVPSYAGNRVSSIDLESQRLINHFEITGHRAMHSGAWLDGFVWITDEEQGVILKLDPKSGKVVCETPTGGDKSHMVIAVRKLNRLYVANMGSGTVSSIDAESRTVRLIPVGDGPEGIDASPDGLHVWVSNREENTVTIISTATDEVVHEFSSHGEFPVKLRIRPDGREAWVVNNRSGSVAVFDVASRQHKRNINIGSRPLGIVFSDDGSRAFVSRPGASLVVEVDTESMQVLRSFQTPRSPDGMIYLPGP